MTKIILIILSLTIIVSCSTETVDKNLIRDKQSMVLLSDTDLTFQTKKQKIRFVVNDSGEIEMLKIYGDTNPQVIHFHENGNISQLINKKNKNEYNVLYFKSSGQIIKIKTFDHTSTNGGDQFIWFANSDSKSLLIDYDATHIPLVFGLKDTFDINKENNLLFKTIDTNAENAIIELKNIEYDTTALKIVLPKNKLNCLSITAYKKGTYRITGSVVTNIAKMEPKCGILNKLEFNVTFR